MAASGLIVDHLVIGAATLGEGVAFVRSALGVDVPPGGKHPRMGTHNHLTRIGEGVFLEIIALDPEAADPGRPRWFDLDAPEQRQRLAMRPRLIAWVAGTRDLAGALAGSPVDLGRPLEMRRDHLVWQIGIRDDGRLIEGGLLPVLIEWRPSEHPASAMPDLGLRLERLRLVHREPERISAILAALGGSDLAEVVGSDEEPRIEADLRLPDGRLATLG